MTYKPSKSSVAMHKKERALALLKLFRNRIKNDLFEVDMANWWVAGSNNKVILRIDTVVGTLEDLEEFDETHGV